MTAALECSIVEVVEQGYDRIVVGVVGDLHQSNALDCRADEAILRMKDLGYNIFHGG
jgi:flavin reductase (DIM6/NTAB) family NADH-FMN oxidoreductase RutF